MCIHCIEIAQHLNRLNIKLYIYIKYIVIKFIRVNLGGQIGTKRASL